jgi:RluA family pseudouridine synthase
MKTLRLVVSKKLAGKRLDIAISLADLGLSRRKAKAIIDIGGGFVNKKRVRIASREVREGDVIELRYDAEQFSPKKIIEYVLRPEDVLYEDDHVVAINKPPGVPSQPTRSQAIYHVVSLVEKYFGRKGFHLVHRLDQETTGVILVAKSKDAMNDLTEQFKGREMAKVYHALSWGISKQKNFKEECYLSAIGKDGTVRPLVKGGKYSLTKFSILKADPKLDISWLACYPSTGRSHQIRVHLAKNNLPILGDKKYGDKKRSLPPAIMEKLSEHHLLHAYQLTFTPPKAEKTVTVTAPYPPNWTSILQLLGWS